MKKSIAALLLAASTLSIGAAAQAADVKGALAAAQSMSMEELYAKAKEEVKAGSPVGKYTKHKGRYKKGWAVKEETVSRLQAKAIVHNRTDYQLAHLLEKGHVLKRGGRTLGRVPAQVHIAPAEEHAIKNFEEAVEKIAKG